MLKNNRLRTIIKWIPDCLVLIADLGWWSIDPSVLTCLTLIVVLFRISNRFKRWLSRF